MAKKIKSFLTYSVIIIIILIIVTIGLLLFNYYIGKNKIYEGIDSDYFTIKLDDLSNNKNDPNPMGLYTVSTLNSSIISDFSSNLLFHVKGDTPKTSSEVITIVPNKTNPEKPHFANIFPSTYKITILFSSGLFDFSDTNNFIDTSKNSIRALNVQTSGQILDTSYNVIGYSSKDQFNPYKFTISIYDNVNINEININYKTAS